MKRNAAILIGIVFILGHILSGHCLAAEVIEGVTAVFNPAIGALTIQTSEKEIRVYLSETVDIQVTPRLGSEPVPADWDFLRHNLFAGTKVSLEISNGIVTCLIVTEVPQ